MPTCLNPNTSGVYRRLPVQCFRVSSWANLEDIIWVISAPSGTAEDFKHQLSLAQYPHLPFLCQLKRNHEQHSSKPDFARRLTLSSCRALEPPDRLLTFTSLTGPLHSPPPSLMSPSLTPGCHMRSTQSGQRLGYCACEEQRGGTGRDMSSRRRETLDSTTQVMTTRACRPSNPTST